MASTETKEGAAYWEKRWIEGATRFHCLEVHPFLKSNVDKLTNGKVECKKIFVPFCGKTIDMKYLYDHGLSVVGVEFSALAVESFFKEHSLNYEVSECDSLKVFKHDERLMIVQGDLFKVTPDIIGGACNLHWDRGGLVALEECDHQKYVNHIKSMLSPDSTTLTEMFEYDASKRTGPPRCILVQRLQQLFGNDFKIEELKRVANDDMPLCCNRLEGVTHVAYIIKRN